MNPIESHLLLILGKGLALSAAFFVLALVLLRGRSAQAVSLYWRTALAGLMIIPIISLLLPWLNVATPIPNASSSPTAAAEPAFSNLTAPARPDKVIIVPLTEETVDVIEASPVAEADAPVAANDTPARNEWRPTFLLGLWALGFAIVLARWMASWARGRRLVKSGTDASSAMWEQEMARLGETGPRLRLVISEGVSCPIVFASGVTCSSCQPIPIHGTGKSAGRS